MPAFRITEVRKATVIFAVVALFLLGTWSSFGGPVRSKLHNMSTSTQESFEYEVVPGVFMQDDPATEWADFDPTQHNFGLIDREYDTDGDEASTLTSWQRLDRFIRALAAAAPSGVSYKMLYMGRHGQGFHNVAESHYGTEAWDDHWSKLEGDGKVIWADAHLTDIGKEQVLQAHDFIVAQLSEKLMPASESYYVSPLYRCLQTANLTYAGLKLPHDRPFKPVIKELLREDNGEHTCDRRSSRTVIHRAFPEWRFESGFSEQDLLWRADRRETHDEHDVRTRTFMDELFSSDRSTYVSLTSHSGAIASKLRVLGHRDFPLPTGGMIPVLVKATKRVK